jgi:hypothetical protein
MSTRVTTRNENGVCGGLPESLLPSDFLHRLHSLSISCYGIVALLDADGMFVLFSEHGSGRETTWARAENRIVNVL